MSQYSIRIESIPGKNNEPVDTKMTLSDSQLLGVITMAYAILGPQDLRYFTIWDRSMKKIDINQRLKATRTILLSGEAAFEADEGPEGWIASLTDAGGRPTKRYTVKIQLPNSSYVVQFDDLDFLQGMDIACGWIGLNCPEYLFMLHDGDNALDNACCS